MRALVSTRVLETQLRLKKHISYPRSIRITILERRTLCNPKGHHPSEVILETVDNILSMIPDRNEKIRRDSIYSLCKAVVTRRDGVDPDMVAGLRISQFPKLNCSLDENTLAAAVCLGYKSIVEKLLGKQVQMPKTYFGFALERAAARKDVEMMQMILQVGPPSINAELATISEICWRGYLSCLEVLFDPAYRVDLSNSLCLMGIRKASFHGQSDLIQYIFEHAPLSKVLDHTILNRLIQCNDGPRKLDDYIFNHACAGGKLKVARRAIENGANREVRNKHSSEPPLVVASERGYHEITALILENGITDGLTKDIKRAFMVATKRGWPQVVKVLIDKGAEVNPQGNETSPLLQAINFGQDKVVDLLLKNGAKPPEMESDHQLWYNYSRSRGFTAVIAVMNSHGMWQYE
jgi:ankyrin repeat protein